MQRSYILGLAGFGFICIGLCWVVFGHVSQNPSVDALAYTQTALHGQDGVQAHHILHGLLACWVYGSLLRFCLGHQAGCADLQHAHSWLACTNSLGYLALLFWVFRILGGQIAKLPPSKTDPPALSLPLGWLLVASSWGVLRFSTEFEAYIWPLACCAAGLFYYHKCRWSPAGWWFCLALLFHQLAAIWVLPALVLGGRQGKQVFFRLLYPTLAVVPLMYIGVYVLLVAPAGPAGSTWGGLVSFVLGEFETGGVKNDWQAHHVGLWCLSVLRSFLQLHGYHLYIVHKWPTYAAALGLAAGLVAALAGLLGWLSMPKHTAFSSTSKRIPSGSLVARWALVVTLVAGLWAQGNAEFMAGLPLAVAVGYGSFLERWPKLSLACIALLLGWNVAFGLLPQTELVLTPYRAEAALVATPGPALATYHKLEVDTWAGPKAQRATYHAQHITSHRGRFYINGVAIADTLILIEQMPTALVSRASLLEAQTSAAPGRIGKTIAVFEHLAGPTKVVEMQPFN